MSASWVHNLLNGQAEVDRIILEEKDKKTGFVVVRDLKWNGTNIKNLHLQAIVCRRDIRSVRDLTANELPLLEGIRDKVLQLLEEEWELREGDLMMYFHYQPSYYHLHIHIIFIEYEAPGLNSTAIDLFTVIDNLKYPDYYKEAILPFDCKRTDALYQKFAETGHMRLDTDVKVVELSFDKNLQKSRPSKKKRNKMKSQAGTLDAYEFSEVYNVIHRKLFVVVA